MSFISVRNILLNYFIQNSEYSHEPKVFKLIYREIAVCSYNKLFLTLTLLLLQKVTSLKLTSFRLLILQVSFKCLTFQRIFTFFFLFGFCISLFSTAIFHLLCNCEQGNETPPFLRNIYYLHAFSNFQQSQFLLEWIRWLPFLMYQLACILICLTPFSDSLWKILMTHLYIFCLILKNILPFSFNHLFTFSIVTMENQKPGL